MFQSGCRKKEDYLAQLNRSLGRATMNLSWKNRFLESRDAVISQFRELSVILEEFSHQIDRARDITDEYEYILKKYFKRYHVALGNLLLLEYENGQKEAFLTARTTNGRCITSKDAALIMGEVMDGTRWSPAKDSRSIITKQYETVRFLEEGGYRMLYGASRIPKKGEKYSGDNYTFCESPGSQAMISLCDGMGCGEAAQRESAMAVRLLERFLRAGIDAPPALKTLNSALSLRAESTDSFTTIDLLTLSLRTLEGELYKYGAAPSYLKRGGSVRRVTCSCLPAGLQEGSPPPEAGWEGREPRQLAAAILADSLERRGGTDDAGVLVLYIPEELSGAQEI